MSLRFDLHPFCFPNFHFEKTMENLKNGQKEEKEENISLENSDKKNQQKKKPKEKTQEEILRNGFIPRFEIMNGIGDEGNKTMASFHMRGILQHYFIETWKTFYLDIIKENKKDKSIGKKFTELKQEEISKKIKEMEEMGFDNFLSIFALIICDENVLFAIELLNIFLEREDKKEEEEIKEENEKQEREKREKKEEKKQRNIEIIGKKNHATIPFSQNSSFTTMDTMIVCLLFSFLQVLVLGCLFSFFFRFFSFCVDFV